MTSLTTDVLVVGGGTGGTAAAIQAARKGAQVILVSDGPWLGGMLTSAGVSAPDGNELAAFQTGIWGEFLKELRRRHPEGLDQGWVSFFTYNPAVGAQIFADWVAALPNLKWMKEQAPTAVIRTGDRILGVEFPDLTIRAKITIDATELGDLLALGDIPHRWGWETKAQWQEPSAPASFSDPEDPLYAITQTYPVQSPTWVVIMQDYGENAQAPPIPCPDQVDLAQFEGAWANCTAAGISPGEHCLNYGRLPGDRFMINWPHNGNDYGVDLHRLIESPAARIEYGQQAQAHSIGFAHFIQQQLGQRYGLADACFPETALSPGGGVALMPYYRESRRLVGVKTVIEQDILPVEDGQVAALPVNHNGEMSAIALGNYPNDHHYPGYDMPLAPKAIRWGGRWTGTPFTIPYEALVPETIDGFLAAEKNISVSHIANGATRLQPVVLGIGQAAGMAAALCVEKDMEPRGLDVRSLQLSLLNDPYAPAALIPLFNVAPQSPQWQPIQQSYLDLSSFYHPSGYHIFTHASAQSALPAPTAQRAAQTHAADNSISHLVSLKGIVRIDNQAQYKLHQITDKKALEGINLVTVRSDIAEKFSQLTNSCSVYVQGRWNAAGNWLLCEQIKLL